MSELDSYIIRRERGKYMKIIKIMSTLLAVLLVLLFMTACDKKKNDMAISTETSGILGSWAYIHDRETTIAVFREDGIAQYEGKDYTFESDSQFIKLMDDDDETLQLRYLIDDEGIYLYSNNTYSLSGKGKPDGLLGEWSCPEKNWSFSFTEGGTFIEDGYFPGYYTVDDENSTIKLVYNDQFEDTICYFRLEENRLHIEYPWRMVRTSNK